MEPLTYVLKLCGLLWAVTFGYVTLGVFWRTHLNAKRKASLKAMGF